MKYIILAAGKGTRMEKYTKSKPKVLLTLNGMSLLERHVHNARYNGIYDITVIKGYKSDMIRQTLLKYYTNQLYKDTNMVESLMIARSEFDDDVILAYGDIMYNKDILSGLIGAKGDFVVTVDKDWRKYWKMRHGTTEFDIESLKITNGNIVDIGKEERNSDHIDARFVGLMKFTKKGLRVISDLYDHNPGFWKKAYTTDLLQELILLGHSVAPYEIDNGWLEFDNETDYEKAQEWFSCGREKELNLCFW